MGGLGSGRKYQHGKNTTAGQRSLDVRWLHREGMLDKYCPQSIIWSRAGKTVDSIQIIAHPDNIILKYQYRQHEHEAWRHTEYPVMLEWTACRYGGQRPWFLCPAQACGRRVAILYIGNGGLFTCRHCRQLVYVSQRESDLDRIIRKADKIRDRLEWQPGIINPPGGKPKGMHWRTYEKLMAAHNHCALQALRGLDSHNDKIKRRVEKLEDQWGL